MTHALSSAGTTVSFWERQLPARPERPSLSGDTTADVCIVGGGFTGLWTAYYLAKAAPGLRLAIVESRYCGYGASGRNGGWVSNFIAGSRDVFAKTAGREATIALQREMDASVDEVVRVAEAEGIDADMVKGGVLTVARWRSQWDRLQRDVAAAAAWGEDDLVLLDADAFAKRLRVSDALGGSYSPHCARMDPAKLVRGLAERVEELGVRIYESTPATAVGRHVVETPGGRVAAKHIVVATEGFLARMPGQRRRTLPMNSSMVVTERLSDRVWDRIGWEGAELLGDSAHVYFYAQRTADGRIAFGGRGNPYRYGSQVDTDGQTPQSTVTALRAQLIDCFPDLGDVRIENAWSGVLGVPRDWCSSVVTDESTGVITVGGYVGHGVTTTNLAGRTIRDLILEADSDLLRLPWVGHRVRSWEPEPLRWMGVQGMYAAYRTADAWERRTGGRTSIIANVANLVAGR